jgi:hypothetical protein
MEEEAGIGGWVFGECVSLMCGLVLKRERESEREGTRESLCTHTHTAQQREGHGVFFAYPLTFVSLISRKTEKQRKKKGRASMEYACEQVNKGVWKTALQYANLCLGNGCQLSFNLEKKLYPQTFSQIFLHAKHNELTRSLGFEKML